MLGRLHWALAFAGLVTACAGSDGHPPAANLDVPSGGSDGGAAIGTVGGGSSTPSKSLFDGGVINLPQVSDIALDEKRGLLYVSTTQGGLATVDLATSEISSQKLGDHALTGMDLSPDGKYLAVGEQAIDQGKRLYWIHLIDLEEGTVREIYFPIPPMALVDGSQSVAFADDHRLLISASWMAIGYVELLLLDVTDDSVVSLKNVLSDTMLHRSADGSVVAYVEPVHGEGAFGEVDVSSLDIADGLANLAIRDLAVSADGAELAFPSIGVIKVFASDGSGYKEHAGLGKDGRDGAAAVFSPVANSLFVSWTKNTNDGSAAFIERYAADDLSSEGVVAKSVALATSRESGYVPVRMKMWSDGSLLFVTVDKGINVYRIEP